jgi:ATPases involved in chromosome partitioning
MSQALDSAVQAALQTLQDPQTGASLVAEKAIKNLRVDGGDVSLEVELGYPARSLHANLQKQVIAALRAVPGVQNVSVAVRSRVVSHAVQRGLKPLPEVKNIIAVASGKGGVGKSTTAANLALALAAEGAVSACLTPTSTALPAHDDGRSGQPQSRDGQNMEPLENYGVQIMSIGFLIEADNPMIWRGPMATQALNNCCARPRGKTSTTSSWTCRRAPATFN